MSDDARTDAALLAATAGGDSAAFAVLVRRYVRSATLLGVQLLGDADEADDVVQDAFMVVHEQARTFDNTRPFSPWFFSIVRRLATKRRTRDLRRARLLRLWGNSAEEASLPPVDCAIFAEMSVAAAKRAMDDLSPMQRACFELVTVRNLSIEDVATIHGISESTVRQHVFRARATLRGMLDAE